MSGFIKVTLVKEEIVLLIFEVVNVGAVRFMALGKVFDCVQIFLAFREFRGLRPALSPSMQMRVSQLGENQAPPYTL